MGFPEAIQVCLSKYSDFSGRASRSEYWWVYLFCVLMSWGVSVVGAITLEDGAATIPSLLLNLAFMLPSFAAGVRRLHDTNHSGWWLLLLLTVVGVILLIVWFASKSDEGANRYGQPPTS